MNYAIISKNNKKVAVVIHNPKEGRVVFKGNPTSDLYQAFSLVYGKPVVVTDQEGKSSFRRKIVQSDKDYLSYLTDKFVHFPYVVSSVESNDSNRIDDVADKLEKEHLDDNS